jgi:hypothetical protein
MATTKKKPVSSGSRSPAAKRPTSPANVKKSRGRASKKASPATLLLPKTVTGKTPVAKTAAGGKARAAGLTRQPKVREPLANANSASSQKTKKPKLVRDSFTIPKAEYQVLQDLKFRASRLTRPAKKSELLRAGVKALAALSDAAFLAALEKVPAIKTGRPALNP